MKEATLIQQLLADAGIDSEVVFDGSEAMCPVCRPILQVAA